VSNIYLERLRALSGKPMVQEPTKPTKGHAIHGMPAVQEPTKPTKEAYVGFVGCRTTGIAENETTPALPDLLRQHGGFPGVDWPGLSLTDAQESALWIVQRPDGLLTVLATVEPISRPLSYRQAWPARFTTPESADDFARQASRLISKHRKHA
jgi:hypothetical protein